MGGLLIGLVLGFGVRCGRDVSNPCSADNLSRIETEMTMAEVRAILGPPNDMRTEKLASGSLTIWTYIHEDIWEGTSSCAIMFDENRKVIRVGGQ